MKESNEPAGVHGVYAALLTPRRTNSAEVDTAGLFEYLDNVSATGVDGLVFFGSTGEFVHFDSEERMEVFGLAAKRSRLPVLVNVSHSTLAGTVALAEHAIDSGAAGVLLMPPYFYRFEDDVVAEFYEQFVKGTRGVIPTYLYNLPSCTTGMSSALAERLLSSGAVAGIKDSSGDWDLFQTLVALRTRKGFQLLVGNEALFLKGFQAGADGSISGVASALPELPLAIHRAVKAGDVQAFQRLSAQLDELLEWIVRFPPVVALKQLAQVRGWMRLELAVPISHQKREELLMFGRWLAEWLPEVLAVRT